MSELFCFHCSTQNSFSERIHFRDECQRCGEDLHICRNCTFYDETSYNECKESSAEKVQDKEKRNVCEYFSPSSQKPSKKNSQDLLKQAESLFKKSK